MCTKSMIFTYCFSGISENLLNDKYMLMNTLISTANDNEKAKGRENVCEV